MKEVQTPQEWLSTKGDFYQKSPIAEMMQHYAEYYYEEQNKGFYKLKWHHVSSDPPPINKKVIRSDYRVEGHPEYDNQTIDYITKDCTTGQKRWQYGNRKPNDDEYWMELIDSPLKP